MRIITAHKILKVCLAYLIFKNVVSQSLKFGPKWWFLYFKPILSAIFVTIATFKVKWMPDLYIWVVILINQSEEIDVKQISVLGSRGCKT